MATARARNVRRSLLLPTVIVTVLMLMLFGVLAAIGAERT